MNKTINSNLVKVGDHKRTVWIVGGLIIVVISRFRGFLVQRFRFYINLYDNFRNNWGRGAVKRRGNKNVKLFLKIKLLVLFRYTDSDFIFFMTTS